MILKNVRIRDGVYIAAFGRSFSGALGPGEVIGPWVAVNMTVEGRSERVLFWGAYLAPSELDVKQEGLQSDIAMEMKNPGLSSATVPMSAIDEVLRESNHAAKDRKK